MSVVARVSAAARLDFPSGAEYRLADVQPLERWILKREHVVVECTERALRTMFHSPIEGFNNAVCESLLARIRCDDSLAFSGRKLLEATSHYVHSGPRLNQCDLRAHEFRNAGSGVKRDSVPDDLDLPRRDPTTSEKVGCGIGAIDLKAELAVAILLCQSDVVEHASRVKQFRVEDLSLSVSGHRSPEVDPNGVMKEQVALSVTDELRDFVGELAVRDSYSLEYFRHDETS